MAELEDAASAALDEPSARRIRARFEALAPHMAGA
jgi:hypothetical protein